MRHILAALYSMFILRPSAILLLPRKGKIDFGKVKKILVYGQMGIGNMILYTPVIKALRNSFRDAHITLLVGKGGCEQVVDGGGLVDEIIKCELPDLPFSQRWRFIFQMRKRKFDLIVSNFHGSRRYLVWLTILSGAPYRLGHTYSIGIVNMFSCLYNYWVKMDKNKHELDMNICLMNKLGIRVVDRTPSFYVGTEDEQFATEYFKKHGITKSNKVIGVSPGSNPKQEWKRWDSKKYAKLADKLLRDSNIKMIALGSPGERQLIEATFSDLSIKPIIASGEVTLGQTAAIINRSDCLVSNDGGLMHVAVAMNTPVVAICGPTDYVRTGPLGKQNIIIRKDLPCSPCYTVGKLARVESCQNRICLESITVEEVLEAVRRQLKRQ
ncbi:MAG: glycosyltransferase family 9 protein [Dehalococcoidales bacterium]|nr:glycosyltransferase family 9 protein [Dehalococcoidales bacterium]